MSSFHSEESKVNIEANAIGMEFCRNGAEEVKSELPDEIRYNCLMRKIESLMAKNQELMKIIKENGLEKKNQVSQSYGSMNGGIPVEQFPSSSVGRTRRQRHCVDLKNTKLPIAKFNGKEVHPGLGANFREWGENFIEQLVTAQDMVEQNWSEALKIQILGSKLDGAPLIYFNQNRCLWRSERKIIGQELTLDFVMARMDSIYSQKITVDRGIDLMRKPKPASRSWKDHLVYLSAVNVAMGGGHEAAVLQSLVKHAKPSLTNNLKMYYNKYRKDYGVMALEIVDRAEDEDPSNEHKIERSGKVNNVREKMCYNCNKSGHIARFCRSKIQDSKVNSVYDKDDNVADVFNVTGSRSRSSRTKRGKEITWILDSGSSLHFVNDQKLLQDLKKVSRKGVGFNDSVVRIENEGNVTKGMLPKDRHNNDPSH
jgi:hypothetical protein